MDSPWASAFTGKVRQLPSFSSMATFTSMISTHVFFRSTWKVPL